MLSTPGNVMGYNSNSTVPAASMESIPMRTMKKFEARHGGETSSRSLCLAYSPDAKGFGLEVGLSWTFRQAANSESCVLFLVCLGE